MRKAQLEREKQKQKQKRKSNKIGENRLFSLKITSIGSESFSLNLHLISESGKIFAFSKCISHNWNQPFLLWNQFLSLSQQLPYSKEPSRATMNYET